MYHPLILVEVAHPLALPFGLALHNFTSIVLKIFEAGLALGTKGKGSFLKGSMSILRGPTPHVTVTVIPMWFLQVSQNSSSFWVMIQLMNQDHPSE